MVTDVASAFANPLFCAAIRGKLAAILLTSYSNGPGQRSSKSFRSNSRSTFGRGERTKFDR